MKLRWRDAAPAYGTRAATDPVLPRVPPRHWQGPGAFSIAVHVAVLAVIGASSPTVLPHHPTIAAVLQLQDFLAPGAPAQGPALAAAPVDGLARPPVEPAPAVSGALLAPSVPVPLPPTTKQDESPGPTEVAAPERVDPPPAQASAIWAFHAADPVAQAVRAGHRMAQQAQAAQPEWARQAAVARVRQDAGRSGSPGSDRCGTAAGQGIEPAREACDAGPVQPPAATEAARGLVEGGRGG
jgi:hypothetical protein